MFGNVLSVKHFAFSVCFACAATTVWAAESKFQSLNSGQCAKGACAASESVSESGSASACESGSCSAKACSSSTCAAKACSEKVCSGKNCCSAADTLVSAADSKVNALTASSGCCKTQANDAACCKTANKCSACSTENVVAIVEAVTGCTCPSATAGTTGCDTQCECGTACQCSKSASAHVAVLHERLVRESAKIAKLTAQIQLHEELAQTREEFNKRMLAKDVELVHLQAQLELAAERSALNQKVATAVAENVQLQASLRVAQSQMETLKHQVTERTREVTTALADSRASEATLNERIAELKIQLEMVQTRLAKKPTDQQVQ